MRTFTNTITAEQRYEYANQRQDLRHALEDKMIGSPAFHTALNTALQESVVRQSSPQLRNRLVGLVRRLATAPDQEAVAHVFQWSN